MEKLIEGLKVLIKKVVEGNDELKEIRKVLEEIRKEQIELSKKIDSISYRYWVVNRDKLEEARKDKKENKVENKTENKNEVVKVINNKINEKQGKQEKPYYEEEIEINEEEWEKI
ncbi:MAG: hypothetical protein ACPL1F_02340 [bacterium]